MHHRLSLWLAIFLFAAAGVISAQTPASPSAPSAADYKPGQIKAKQVTGRVVVQLNGTTTDLHNDDDVAESATVITAPDSSVILVFSNGATTQLGADTTLIIEEFLQKPFDKNLLVANLTAEPTTSKTRLRLTKGELTGKVAKLKHDEGSSFTVQTPVGAAGIRGTTFRIVFRPQGTGQAFAVFSLSTLEGNVNFQQGSTAGGPAANVQTPQGQTQGQGQGPADAQGQPGTQGQAQGQGQASAQGQTAGQGMGVGQQGGLAVTGGQEVVVTLTVAVNQQTGAVTLTAPPTITATQPMSVETQAVIVQQAQALVTTAATTTFTPTPPAASTPTPSTPQPTDTQQQQQQQQGDSNSQGTSNSGGTNSNASSNSNSSNTSSGNNANNSGTSNSGSNNSNSSGNQSGGTTNKPVTPTTPVVPPVTTPTQPLTPGAGRSPG